MLKMLMYAVYLSILTAIFLSEPVYFLAILTYTHKVVGTIFYHD